MDFAQKDKEENNYWYAASLRQERQLFFPCPLRLKLDRNQNSLEKGY